ncbi:family 1 encapsulin nanocompartment shell protein [Gordonia sp. DT30]|uniref:family 1 encapsulin nanocompartment shell protein n=1 Tax=unclassified Gordonia (in: high G+C Gram-positive bacteria) TaxID=2657482 RepID=UPI003CF1A72A
MNNLHRELAPISASAWEAIEEEATRSLRRNIAGRRLVDVKGPLGLETSAVTRGHRSTIDSPADGILAFKRHVQPLIELKVPFTVTRTAIDDVDRGALDSDWDPVVEAARQLALAEDRAVFEGYPAAGISGIRAEATATPIGLPDDVRDYPQAFSQALSTLKLASIDGPYSIAVSADVYTLINETSDHGYPVREHIQRLIDGEIVWAPAITGAFVLSTRGGDFELTIGQDVSIGYDSHDADVVNLYFQESFTYLTYTGEAAVALAGA